MQGGRKEEEAVEGKQERKPFWKEAKREMEDRGGKKTERETER